MADSGAAELPTVPTLSAIPRTDDGAVVWHRRGLRTHDHAALTRAATNYEEVLPLFVFDPAFYGSSGLACDARIEFCFESLSDLDRQYEAIGGRLWYAHGPPVELLSRFADRGWDVLALAEPTGRYGRRRDRAAAHVADVHFLDDDGLVRGRDDSRTNWSEHVEAWFSADQLGCPTEIQFADVDFGIDVDLDGSLGADTDADTDMSPGGDVSPSVDVDTDSPCLLDRVRLAYDVDSTKQRIPRGGRQAGRRRLEQFTRSIGAYPGRISAPSAAEDGTSRLSPYLRFGCLSLREVYQYVEANAADDRGASMFRSRLYWNRHYTQKLEDWPGWMDRAVNPVMTDFYADSADPDRLEAWKTGQTGYPMVDASMRCLAETGWLNFRMRAMCVSFLCDLLAQPWKPGADWFYYHLIDADPAINYTQFQTQAGVVGTSMLRIYNPRKQVRDNDPEGEFIHEWVPELRGLPPRFLDRPERTPVSVQADCGVDIGTDYPYPIVEYEAARSQAVSRLEAVREDAHRALEDPEVARRASFSRRRRQSSGGADGDENADGDDDQSSLTEFG